MSSIKTALIMAAGRGTRMAPLTDSIPKPMAPYGGTTLIANGIDRLAGALEHIYVTVGYKKAMLAQHVIEHGASGVFNTDGKGNAWWVYGTLLSQLDEPILVLTADNVVEIDIPRIYNEYRECGEPACMLVPVVPVPGLEGDFVFHENKIVRALSRNEVSSIYCSGIQVLNPKKVIACTNATEDFGGLWYQLIRQNRLMVSSVYPEKWISVDTVEQLTALNNSLANKLSDSE
jgi:NDP-sugar pyrophosphorylase family protein